MKRISFTVAAATTFTAAAVGLAGSAWRRPPREACNAADAVKELQADGYNVQINGECDRSVVRLRNHRRIRRSQCRELVGSAEWLSFVYDRPCRRLVPR